MYDAGGISLKPARRDARGHEARHVRRRRRSSPRCRALAEPRVPTAVTGYLMCTDNMPSGTAMRLGDVHHDPRRHDRRGRSTPTPRDASSWPMASSSPPRTSADAIVDIATLTGAAHARLRHAAWPPCSATTPASSTRSSGRARATDERVWQLPLRTALSQPARLRRSPTSRTSAASNARRDHRGALPRRVRRRACRSAHLDICGADDGRPRRARGDSPDAPGSERGSSLELALDFRNAGGPRRRRDDARRRPPCPRGSFTERLLDGDRGTSATRCRTRSLMFLYLIIIVIVLSHVLYLLGVSVTDQIAVPDAVEVVPDYYEDTTQPILEPGADDLAVRGRLRTSRRSRSRSRAS